MTARIEPSLLGKMTERRVIRVLQQHGQLSRAEVARHTGLSAPAVSRAVAVLLQLGLLEEADATHATGGRPATRLRLARQSAQVLGIALDAGRCRLVRASLDGEAHGGLVEVPTPATYEALLDALAVQAAALMRQPDVTTLGVGLSVPGLIDYRAGRCLLSPNVPMTDGQTPALDLGARLGVECVMLQEAHALCLGEQHYGLARELDDFAMLDVTTGVGLGVVSGGRLLTGHSGLAGEFGHITVLPEGGRRCGCGNAGCLETVANDSALAWRVGRRLGRAVTIDEVIALSVELDLSAELDETCRFLGIGLAAVINVFNPARLFVYGRLFDAGAGVFDKMVEMAQRRALRPSFADCRVLRATAQKSQGAIAGIIQHLTSAIAPALESKALYLSAEAPDGVVTQ